MNVGDVIEIDGQEATVVSIKGSRAIVEIVGRNGVTAKKSVKLPSEASQDARGRKSKRSKGKPSSRPKATPEEAERAVTEMLGGVHVVDITKEGMVCPPASVTNVASHLKIMHGVELTGLPVENEYQMLKIHEELHDAPYHEPVHPHTHREEQ